MDAAVDSTVKPEQIGDLEITLKPVPTVDTESIGTIVSGAAMAGAETVKAEQHV
ncbi:hypothetical protein PMIN07_008939 [Paraphaeosphaeria minitans]